MESLKEFSLTDRKKKKKSILNLAKHEIFEKGEYEGREKLPPQLLLGS